MGVIWFLCCIHLKQPMATNICPASKDLKMFTTALESESRTVNLPIKRTDHERRHTSIGMKIMTHQVLHSAASCGLSGS